jgi:hypothetical protein
MGTTIDLRWFVAIYDNSAPKAHAPESASSDSRPRVTPRTLDHTTRSPLSRGVLSLRDRAGDP